MAKIPMGPNERGEHPHKGARTDVHFAGPIHHTVPPSYGMAAQTHTHATLGKPAKPKLHDIAVHGSMTRQQIEQAGSKHLLSDALVDPGSATDLSMPGVHPSSPKMGKVLPVPACNPGTPSRAERGQYDPATGARVIGEAIISGSTRLPDSTDEQT